MQAIIAFAAQGISLGGFANCSAALVHYAIRCSQGAPQASKKSVAGRPLHALSAYVADLGPPSPRSSPSPPSASLRAPGGTLTCWGGDTVTAFVRT